MTMPISVRPSSGWEGRSGCASSYLGPKQPEQDRQADLPAAQAVELHDEHDDDPAVPPPCAAPGAFGLGAVVEVVRPEHAAACGSGRKFKKCCGA